MVAKVALNLEGTEKKTCSKVLETLLGERVEICSKKVRKLGKRVENALKSLWHLGVEGWGTVVKKFLG